MRDVILTTYKINLSMVGCKIYYQYFIDYWLLLLTMALKKNKIINLFLFILQNKTITRLGLQCQTPALSEV